jgi:hypothetical protein
MQTLLKLEEVALFVLALYLYSYLPYAWWIYAVLFLAPDLGALGYLVNTRIGAMSYNLFHHRLIAVGCYLAGSVLAQPFLQFIGLLLFGHISFDRAVGYGLKYPDSFKHTHLGWLGSRPA